MRAVEFGVGEAYPYLRRRGQSRRQFVKQKSAAARPAARPARSAPPRARVERTKRRNAPPGPCFAIALLAKLTPYLRRRGQSRRRRLDQKEFRKQKSAALRSNRSARIRRAALGSASRAREIRKARLTKPSG